MLEHLIKDLSQWHGSTCFSSLPVGRNRPTNHLTCQWNGSNPCPNGDRARVLSNEPAGPYNVGAMLQWAGLQKQQISLLMPHRIAHSQVNALDLIQEFLACIIVNDCLWHSVVSKQNIYTCIYIIKCKLNKRTRYTSDVMKNIMTLTILLQHEN